MNPEQEKLLYAKINLETAQIPWKELERFFAGGRIISVDDSVDMIRVAQLMAADDVKAVSDMLEKKEIGKVTDSQARIWSASDALLWAVVVKPWILVQQRKS
ncbi:DUF2288 domain-containing protein [Oxalobacter paraformigenes]|uniref:DUF2288 domain-containing protein n=1 Tax=Oxalobacter paraformigenes TaxID=556268 RepID=C3X6B1_9BURK|nr:DUF2288 domain-containing protein [Oxalobacter paraformigenes]EEO28747.1 hypothetical protein OFAG_01900 [Oxalobacter paraformigenes]